MKVRRHRRALRKGATLCALGLAALVAGGCGAVDLLRNDPAAPRDRASRFDRFAAELALDLRDTAPLLDRIRWTERPTDLTGGRWDDERRRIARRTVAWKALQRLDGDFSADKFSGDRAATSRIIEADLRRALGLSDEDSIDRSAANPPTEGAKGNTGRGRAVQRLAATPWSGLLIEAPSVLMAEHANRTGHDLEAWEASLGALADEASILAAAPAVLASTEVYAYPQFILDIVLEDIVQLQSSAGAGGAQDPLFGPLLEAAEALPGPASAAFAQSNSQRRRLQRQLRLELGRLAETLTEIRARQSRQPFMGTDALTAGPSEEWLRRMRDAAGPRVDPTALADVAKAEIQRLQLAIGAILGLDPADPGFDGLIRERFEAIRDRELAAPGSNQPLRTPETLWHNVEPHLDSVASDCPPTFVEARTARVFERPHGRWSPFVRGDLHPTDDPLARPSLFLAPRGRDPITPAWLREAEAHRYGLPGRAVVDAFRRAAHPTTPRYLLQFEREAFEEGWGLYAITFASENGLLLEQDQGFGRLGQELVVFVGLIVDLGLSANSWTVPQAIEYVMENSPLPRSSARDLIARAVADPGRPALPAIGLLRLRSLRRGAEALLGEDFDAAEFHAALLSGGPIPMAEIDARIESWLTRRAARGDQ